MTGEKNEQEKAEQPLGEEIQTKEQDEGAPEAGPAGEAFEEPDELTALKKEVEALQAKSEEYLDGWQRERAEFANYKKRMEREREQMRENVTGDLIRRYLEVLDDLERALKNRPQDGEGAAWAEGIDLIYRKLAGILEAEGVELLEAEGKPFDPNLHEAISQEPSDDHESGHVIEVVKNGYRLGDRILRPAMVRVAQ